MYPYSMYLTWGLQYLQEEYFKAKAWNLRQDAAWDNVRFTYSLHCSSFFGLPSRILIMTLVKPQKRSYNGDYR